MCMFYMDSFYTTHFCSLEMNDIVGIRLPSFNWNVVFGQV